MSGWALDHLVVVVSDLEAAAARAEAAGFTVSPGGAHDAIPTANRIIAFADGSYLELLALRDPGARDALRARPAAPDWERHLHEASAVGRRFLPTLAGPEGVGDVCLAGRGLVRWAREARSRGVVLTGPTPMQRPVAPGTRAAWQLVLPADRALPFTIEDETARARRVPTAPEALAHDNGATGIASVRMRTPVVPTAALAWSEAFACTPRVAADGGTELLLGRTRVILEAGMPAGAIGAALAGVAAGWSVPEWGLAAAPAC